MACSESPGIHTLGNGEWLFYVVDRPHPGRSKEPLVVMFHGFTGSHIEAGRLFVDLARALCEAGFAVLRFDYRGHGDSSGAFEEFRISRALEDAEIMLRHALSLEFVDPSRVAFVGLSMGGYVALRMFEKFRPNVKALVLMAPGIVPNLSLMVRVSEDGYAYFGAFRLRGESVRESEDMTAVDVADKIDVPLLLVHSIDDQVVPVQASVMFARLARSSDKKLLTFDRGGHVFEDYSVRKKIQEEVVEWLRDRV